MSFCPQSHRCFRFALAASLSIGFFSASLSQGEVTCFEATRTDPEKVIAGFYEQLEKNKLKIRTPPVSLAPLDPNHINLLAAFKDRKEGDQFFVRIDNPGSPTSSENIIFNQGNLYAEVTDIRTLKGDPKSYAASTGERWVSVTSALPMTRLIREIAENSTDIYYVYIVNKRTENNNHEVEVSSTPPGKAPISLGKITYSANPYRSKISNLKISVSKAFANSRIEYLLYNEAVKSANKPKQISQKLSPSDVNSTLSDLIKRVKHLAEFVEPDPTLPIIDQWISCCSKIQTNYDLTVVLLSAVNSSAAVHSTRAVGYKTTKEATLTSDASGAVSIQILSERP